MEGVTELIFQNGALIWLAVDAGSWLGAQLGMSNGLSQYASFFMGFSHSTGSVVGGSKLASPAYSALWWRQLEDWSPLESWSFQYDSHNVISGFQENKAEASSPLRDEARTSVISLLLILCVKKSLTILDSRGGRILSIFRWKSDKELEIILNLSCGRGRVSHVLWEECLESQSKSTQKKALWIKPWTQELAYSGMD